MRAVVVAMLLAASGALAQPSDKAAAAREFATGQAAYGQGEYLVAAERFEAAWGHDPDPAYLFNIAQAYRLGNACAKAGEFYRRFLAEVPNPPNRARVEQYQAQADACATKQGATTLIPPSGDPVGDPPREEPPATTSPGKGKRTIAIVLAASGVVGLGIGLVSTIQVVGYSDDRATLCPGATVENPCTFTEGLKVTEQDLASRARAAQVRQAVGYAVGGAALIGGIALYLLSRPSATSEAPAVTIVPTEGGAFASGAFRF